MWWALIEEIAPRAEEMAGEKEMARYLKGYHVYIHGYMGSSNCGGAGMKQRANQRWKNFC